MKFLILSAAMCVSLSGCAVVTVASMAAGLAVDATVGVVKLTGKAVGAAVDVATPNSEPAK